jgi:hypothetical protein
MQVSLQGHDVDSGLSQFGRAVCGRRPIARDGPCQSADAVVIHKDKKSDYGVTVPDLPGCFSAGDTWALVSVDLSKLASKAKRINITMPERVLSLVDEQARREGNRGLGCWRGR